MKRLLLSLLGFLSIGIGAAIAADPGQDLIGRAYRVEYGANNAVNVAITADAFGYGIIAAGRVVTGAGLPPYRIETMADLRGNAVVAVSRLMRRLGDGVSEWQFTAAFNAAEVGPESNMSTSCKGNAADNPVVIAVFYENGRKGKPIKLVKAGFRLDRRNGQATPLDKPFPACTATEDPFDG